MNQIRLGDVCIVGAGQPAPKKNEFSTTGIPFIRAGSLEALLNGSKEDTLEKVNPKQATENGLKLYPKDTLVFAKSGMSANIGRIYRLVGDAYVVSHLATLIPTGKYDPTYLMYWLRQHSPSSLINDPSYPSIRVGDIENLLIPDVSVEEQRRIAAILDKADDIRRKQEQALALADDFLRATFLDMFGDLEINPLDWATKYLGELIISSPQNGLYKPSTDYGSGTSILRIDSFYDGYLNRNCEFKKVRISDHEISKYRLNERDIVINRVNSKSHLGKSALIDSLVETTVFESNMMRFSTNEELILPRFMVDQIQSNFVKRQILSKARDSVNQSSINQEDVCNLRIRLPNLNLQKKYIEVVEKNLSNKHSTIRALEQAGGLIKSLSQRAFSGEL